MRIQYHFCYSGDLHICSWIFFQKTQLTFFSASSSVDINPNGRCYASGAEDGYVRLHFFDNDYLQMEDPVPEAEETDEELDEKANE